MKTIFDNETPKNDFEIKNMKIQDIIIKLMLVFFIFIILRMIFPKFIQEFIDNLTIPVFFIIYAICLVLPKNKAKSELNARTRYEKTSELDRMIESEKETTIF